MTNTKKITVNFFDGIFLGMGVAIGNNLVQNFISFFNNKNKDYNKN